MGTMLFATGLMFGDPPEVWNLTKPDVVRRIHRGYLDAGSQILMTNTFGGNRLRLSLHGSDAGRRAQPDRGDPAPGEVDAAGGEALVAGDIGPSGAILAPTGTLDYDEAVDIFAEQAAALVAGGVDLIWIETMSDLPEIKAAIEGVRRVSPGIALITTMTFDTRGHTMMGVSPEQAVALADRLGRRRGRWNCGNGPDELITVMQRMRAADPDAILVAKSNAGMPELVDMRAVYRSDPATMAAAALAMRDAGASIIGGCCGSTPEHLQAIATSSRAESPPPNRCTGRRLSGPAHPRPSGPSRYDTPAMTDTTPSLATPYRTHTCGQLRATDAGADARLAGWVHRRRDHGQLIFLDLRDRHGITQVVIDKADAPAAHEASRVRPEFVVTVAGTVAPRLPGTENAKLPTGDDRAPGDRRRDPVRGEDAAVLHQRARRPGRREPPAQVPLPRHPPRADAASAAAPQPDGPGDPRGPPRQRLRRGRDADAHQEHARGRPRLHRPARLQPGTVYALPQSPQQLKQLLMVAGIDRYFQIARCYRDEDLRGDRQPEFTQLDLEMSFVDEATVMGFVEAMAIEVSRATVPDRPILQTPFPVFTYDEAMERFGSDKPDLRFGMELVDLGPALVDPTGPRRRGSASSTTRWRPAAGSRRSSRPGWPASPAARSTS